MNEPKNKGFPKNLSEKKARFILSAETFFLFIIALIIWACLSFKDNSLDESSKKDLFDKILGLYLPILALTITFWVKERLAKSNRKAPKEFFAATISVTTLYLIIPIFLMMIIWVGNQPPTIFEYLDKFKVYGDTIALVCLGSFFATNNTEAPAPKANN